MLCAPNALSIIDTDAKSTGSPVLLAEPDIAVNDKGNKLISITVKGYTTWDPLREKAIEIGKATTDVNCIMIDSNYDNESFFARLIQFPNSSKPNNGDKALRDYKKQLGDVMDEALWANIDSTESVPFEIPKVNGIAVRITTVTGDMMSKVFSNKDIHNLLQINKYIS